METIGLNIDVKAPGAGQTVGEIRKEIKALTDDVSKLKTGTKEYAAAIASLGEKKAALKDLRDDIKALDPDEKAQAFVRLGTTIAGGFAAASGAAALFGVSNEEIEKQLLRVQAATALLSGVQSLANAKEEIGRVRIILLRGQETIATNLQAASESKNTIVKGLATAAQWLLNAAMSANPIALVVVGIVALVGAYKLFTSSTNDAEAAQAKLNEQLEKENQLSAERVDLMRKDSAFRDNVTKSQIELAKAKGATDADLYALEKERIAERKVSLMNQLEEERYMNAETIRENAKLYEDERLLDALNESKKKEDLSKRKLDNEALLFEENEKIRLIEEGKKEKELEEKNKAFEEAVAEKERYNQLEAESNAFVTENNKLNLEAQTEDLENQLARQATADQADLQNKIAIEDAKFSVAQSGVQGLAALGNLLIKNSQANAKFQKGIALVQIAVDTAQGISAAVAGASKAAKDTGPAAPYTLIAYIASGVASVLGGMAKASQLLGKAPTVAAPVMSVPKIVMPSAGMQNQQQAPALSAPRLDSQQSTLSGGDNPIFTPIVIQNNIIETEVTQAQRRVLVIENRAKIK